MCKEELNRLIDTLKYNADDLIKVHNEEGYLCERDLKFMKFIVENLIFHHKQDKEKEIK